MIGDQHGLRAAARGARLPDPPRPPRPRAARVTADAFALQLRAGAQHGRVFDGAGDDVPGRGPAARAHHAQHRHVIGLGAAAGEDDLGRRGVDQRRQLPPGGLQPLLGGLPEMVDAGSVTIHLTETRHHGVQDLGRDGSGGVVVEIEMLHLLLF